MSEVGIIGQMYENRKSKKIGVLESRDEKFKTLLFRGDDGSSFNVNYSTFKSNWRKYDGDKLIQTSSQVEDAKEEEAAEAVEAEKIVKKAAVKKISEEDKAKAVHSMCSRIEKVSNGRFNVRTSTKGNVNLYAGRKKFAEVWLHLRDEAFEICIRPAFYEGAGLSFVGEVEYKENWIFKYLVKLINLEHLESTMEYLFNQAEQFYQKNDDSTTEATEEE